MVALFSYEFDVAAQNMRDASIELTTLSGYSALIDTAIASKYIASEQEEILKKWREAPQLWTPKS